MDYIFTPANLGQFGRAYNVFAKMMWAFELPTYDDAYDPFNPIRKFTYECNRNMCLSAVPGHINTVNESIRPWKSKGMHICMSVHRKTAHVKRESLIIADCDYVVVIFAEHYEGKTHRKTTDFVADAG